MLPVLHLALALGKGTEGILSSMLLEKALSAWLEVVGQGEQYVFWFRFKDFMG